EITKTKEIFIVNFSIIVMIVLFTVLVKCGLFRFLGKKWGEWEIAGVLNDNIINGHICSKVSNQTLLKIFSTLREINIYLIKIAIKVLIVGIALLIIIEYLFSQQLTNILIILTSGLISFLMIIIWVVIFYELATSPARRECKKILSARKIPFKESPLFSLRMKLKFFPLLTGTILLVVLLLVKSFSFALIFLSFIGLIITLVITDLIFSSIYGDVKDIKESVENLKKGKEVASFFGSLDEEIVDLSQGLNETAQEISNYQKALEQEKTSLEIKVKARTKELEELTQSLDHKVKTRTKELQDRVDELERFHKLTIGRELKMVELKKEIKELKKEIHPVK
ncbi:hypothetical protein AMJ49_06725, partial [Parcubacteria bacterium DG_74_2]